MDLGRPPAPKATAKKACPRYLCNHCQWEGAANSPFRLKEHLDGCQPYQKVLKSSADPPPRPPQQKQMTLKEVGVDAIPKAEKDVLNMAAAKAIITDGRSFGLFESEAFQEFFRKLRPGWDPITRYQVDSRLDDVHKMFQREVMSLFRAAEHLNIIFDASDNVSSHRIVNISVKLPANGPAFYWKTFDTVDQQHTAENWVDIIMPELLAITENNISRINSICTDTENTMRAVHDLLRQKTELKHVNFSLCDSHGQQLMIKDALNLPFFKELMDDVATILTYFSRSKLQMNRLRTCQRKRWLGQVRALIRRCVSH